jgi:hypothetical protein
MADTKWVATIRSRGTGTFHEEAASQVALEAQLGDLHDSLGRLFWGVEEKPAEWQCDGSDGCKKDW